MANTKVTGDLIASLTIATGNIANNAITSDKISGLTTAHITEGANLYYTDARARAAVSVSGNALSYNSSTGVITSNFEESPTFTGNVTVSGTYLTLGGEGYIRSDDSGYLHFQGGTTGTRFFNNANNTALFTILNNGNATFAANVGIGVAAHGTASLNITNTDQHIRLNNGSELGIISLDTDGKLDLWAHGTDETISFRTGTGSGIVTMSVVGDKVGIGVTSPAEKLHIRDASTDANVYIKIANDSRDWFMGVEGSNSDILSFKTHDASNLLNITSGGNVGIGTVSPNAFTNQTSLTINGTNIGRLDLKVGNAQKGAVIASTNEMILDAGASPMQFYSGSTERMRITSGGQVQVGYYNTARGSGNTTFMTGKSGTTYLELNGGDVNGEGGLLFADGSGGNYGLVNYSHVSDLMQFYTASAERMRIDSSGHTSIYGRVGIGDAGAGASSQQLKVRGDSNSSDVIVQIDNTKYGSTDTSGESKIIFGWNNHSAAGISAYKDGTVNRTGFKFYSEVGYNVPVEVMRITSAGNTQLSGNNLDIKGTSAGNTNIRITDSTGTVGTNSLDLINDGTAAYIWNRANTNILFGTNGTEKMRITSGGDVLIGTNGKFLQGKRNTGSVVIDMIGFGAGADTLQIKGGTSGAANAISFYDTGGFLGTWYNGNFGIGTTSPSAKLVVAQSNVTEPSGVDANTSILIKNNTWSGMTLLATSSTGSFITFGDENAGFAGRIQYIHTSDNMTFETAAAERMRVTASGKTLIGITSEQNAGRLQIDSGTSSNGGILDIANGGWYRYYTRVCRNATAVSAAGYWHIKTNIVVNSNTMFMAKFYGYIYGGAQILDLTHAGYAYSGSNTVINQATTNNGSDPNASSAIYSSTTGNKVTFRIAFGTGSNFSTYFAGVMMDMAFPSPAGQGQDFEIEAQTFSTSTTVY